MTRQMGKTKGRRKFFEDALRTFLVGGFAFAGILLGSRKGTRSSSAACPDGLPCRACAVHPGCRKPRAVAARKEIEEPRPGTPEPAKGDGHD
jgi:hypothetical protein